MLVLFFPSVDERHERLSFYERNPFFGISESDAPPLCQPDRPKSESAKRAQKSATTKASSKKPAPLLHFVRMLSSDTFFRLTTGKMYVTINSEETSVDGSPTARHHFVRIGLSLALVRLPRRHIERENTEPAALFRLAPILLYHHFGDCQDLLSLFK